MEGPKRPIEVLMREVAEWVWGFFTQQDETRRRRKQEEEARQKAEVERQQRETEERRAEAARRAEVEARRKEEERLAKHRAKARALAAGRVENLLRAAEWWSHRRTVLDYLQACEARWTAETAGDLSEAQRRWLGWARAETEAMSPFAMGYPAPDLDTGIDADAILLGGPYPELRELPPPPSFRSPTANPSAEATTDQPATPPSPAPPPSPPAPAPSSYPTYAKPQFPYWLLHRGRR